MSTRSNAALAGAGLLLGLLPPPLLSQETLKIDLPPESPVSVVSADWGSSNTTPRGGAMVVDLQTSLRLRNSTQNHIRGITLLVLAQEVTPGGKASVSVPSLNVGPGEVFPVRIDLRLLRPLQGAGPLVRIHLDGVLFEDLSFYGPNRLNSRRSMTVWELQARRDRRYFKSVLQAKGPQGLQREVLASLAREADRPRLGVQLARGGRATTVEAGEEVQFAFLQFPGSPVEPLSGVVRVAAREARDLRLEVRNGSDKEVRHLEIGWIVRDRQGRQFLAGSVPAEMALGPGQKQRIAADTALRFSEPLAVEQMAGFVTQVEFAGGEVWIPTREDLTGPQLERLIAPSPEEQRLTNLYRKKGLQALIGELAAF